MRRNIYLLALLAGMLVSCSKNEVPEPQIFTFTASQTTFPKRDTISYTIDAQADFISFYDGKSIIDLSGVEMPYTHVVGKIRFSVSAPADTIWAKLAVTNVYDSDNIKTLTDSIQLILLD